MDRDQAFKFMTQLLAMMVQRNGSDLFISAGFPPAAKVDGQVTKFADAALTEEQANILCRSIMNDQQGAVFDRENECNFAFAAPGVGRFRVNVHVQQGMTGMVLRTIAAKIPTLDELVLPPVLKDLALTKRGLIIFVGGTGTGKTTSLAALLDHRNEHSKGHIITLEDPIEFVHPHKNCVVMQREIGVDSKSWETALKNALRQAPDVILMGEIRDMEAMGHAIDFAETGHLCLATLHANSTNQAVDRIINFFPPERHEQLFTDLSLNLRAMVSQRLLPKVGGKGRVPAVEIMINTPLMGDLIQKGEIREMKELMKKSGEYGMQTFDQALFSLYEDGHIEYDDAARNADSRNDFRLQVMLKSRQQRDPELLGDAKDLEIVQEGVKR